MTTLPEALRLAEERTCRTCRYWDVHSRDAIKGDCRAPGDHRYWHIREKNGTTSMLDSFGGETTKPFYSCHAWRRGEGEAALDVLPPDHYGHRWQVGPGGISCALCSKPRLDGDVQHACWPPCRDCGRPIVDHNDDLEDPQGKRTVGEFCWQRYVEGGACTGKRIDWRARALAAEKRLAELEGTTLKEQKP